MHAAMDVYFHAMQVPAPKRRKWAAIIDEEFVSRSMSVQQVKGVLLHLRCAVAWLV